MDRKEKITNLYLIILLPVGILSFVWAVVGFPLQKVDAGLAALSVLTIFLGSYLRFQVPRTTIYITVSDALVFLSLILYGGEVAVVVGTFESIFASFNFRRTGGIKRIRTAVINILIAAFSIFVTTFAVSTIFGPPELALEEFSRSKLAWMLTVMAMVQFALNSILVSAFVAIKSDKSLWHVWNEYCLNSLVMYLSGGLMAGLIATALAQIDIFLFAAVSCFFGLMYLTYVRYINQIKQVAAKAEEAERGRAEQAERHVDELQHYVGELEKSSNALRESREKFKHAAYHDELTGLPNRTQFLEALNATLQESLKQPHLRYAVLFLDLNRFKTVNDSLGHSMGDHLLLGVAERLRGIVRDKDIVGRFSGDEFAVLLSGIRLPSDATKFAENLAQWIAEPFQIEGRQIFTSVSIGIAFGHPRYESPEEILRDADIAMYYAKERQKSQVIFDQIMHARAVSLLELETDLRLALERKEFELYYQPLVGLDDVTLTGFEALVRWNHPGRGLITPGEFISIAESTGLIIPMTLQILRSACTQMVKWQSRIVGGKPLSVSVNLSGKHFAHPGLVEHITSILDETGFEPSNLKLEITESAVMENAETAIAMLKRIKATGIKLSIDDFGTGYSSLSYLHRFPIDTLKIDHSFVGSMEEGSENGEIVRTVIALSKALNLSVVAEGIESIHQFHQLRILGCEYGQGYLFSRPLPASEIEKLLDDKYRWQNILPQSDFGSVARNREYTELRLTQ